MDGEQQEFQNEHFDQDPAMESGMDGFDGEKDPAAQDYGQEMDEGAQLDEDNKSEDGGQKVQEQDYSLDPRIQWMCHYLENLDGFGTNGEKCQLNNDALRQFHDFLENEDYQKFFTWIDPEEERIHWNFDAAPKFDEKIKAQDYQVGYFVKLKGSEPVVIQQIEEQIMSGIIDKDPLDDLLDKMTGDYVPKLLGENDWPEGVKKEFVANLHKFMATITEASHQAKGRTYLYIPNEDLTDLDTAVKDKDLIQRLESTVIYWTRQIKELVSNQDSQTSNENQSPIDEIKHWTDRTSNLKVLTSRMKENKLHRIIKVLERSKSSYLPGFKELKDKIIKGHEEAADNLKYLNLLAEPCRKIENAEPKDIPKILPEVLNNLRIIWELSLYYNSQELMMGLLTKISNQIIKRCRAKINRDDMLGGDVEKCMRDLDESIECCRQWKDICTRSQKMISKYGQGKTAWSFDNEDTIFAENEAFIQRCKDLKEICEGQLQFALRGANCKMPVFAGTKGNEWTNSLENLKTMFDKHLNKIKALDYDILDVKITKWHDDYGTFFKEEVKQIEIIYTTIIALTFKHVSTVEDAVEMLENFYQLAKRPSILDYVQKKGAEQVYKLFQEEIKEVEEMFEAQWKEKPPMPVSWPQFGGIAIWVYSLIRRIDRAKRAIDGLYFIPNHPHADEAIGKYQKLRTQLDNFIMTTNFKDWNENLKDMRETKEIDDTLLEYILVKTKAPEADEKQTADKHINNPLFQKGRKIGTLESNFNTRLLKVLIEIQYMNKIQTLGFVTIPHSLSRLLPQRDRLRILRENVMLIVRDYNNIILLINDRERALFIEHLAVLDKSINPGLEKFTWTNAPEPFVKQCRQNCMACADAIKQFQSRYSNISDQFTRISSTIMTAIEKKLYLLDNFVNSQADALALKREEFRDSFEIIKNELMETYTQLFFGKQNKVQHEWLRFIDQLDKELFKSLKNSVKNSLLDLQKHVKGDQTEITPIFRVYTLISEPDENWKVVHEPCHDQLKTAISNFIKDIVEVTGVIPRIEGVFREEREKEIESMRSAHRKGDKSVESKNNIVQKIAKDLNYQNMTDEEKDAIWEKAFELPKRYNAKEKDSYLQKVQDKSEVKQIAEHINEVVEKIKKNMEEDAVLWKGYPEVRQIRNLRTARGKQRFLVGDQDKSKKFPEDPVYLYKSSIDLLEEIVADIRNKPSQKNEQFVILDSQKLKNELQEQGNECIQFLITHVINETKKELNQLLREFTDIVKELKQPCSSLEQLKANKDKYYEVRERQDQMQARMDPIKRKFAFITEDDKGSQSNAADELTEEDKNAIAGLDQAWKDFLIGMNEADAQIKNSYNNQKQEMDNIIEEFKKEVTDLKNNFKLNAPYNVNKTQEKDNHKAVETLREYENVCKEMRLREEDMKFGLEIFSYDPIHYKDLQLVEKENELLKDIWAVKQDWDNQWAAWKDIRFTDLEIEMMEEVAEEIQYKLTQKDKEVKQWPLFEFLRNKIKTFIETMPLITDLRDESMRDRHWKELRYEVKEDFNEKSDSFNLQRIFELNLLNHQNKIGDLTYHAQKQLKVEKALIEIKRMWEEDPATNLDVVMERSKGDNEQYYKINSSENILSLIEDHSVQLSQMKSSPYYKQFDEKIDLWENNIASITETLELLIQVQENWQYLESIFGGQPDIQMQMPAEVAMFGQVNDKFKFQMARINKDPNCYRALIVNERDFIKTLTELNKKLENIQKQLNQLLESKRAVFPRFYFLSNEDLLEILGQAKDPKYINKHIKKIYEGINRIRTTQQGSRSNKMINVEALESPEGELVMLHAKTVTINEKVESWLQKLTLSMQEELRSLFFKYHSQYANQSRKPIEKTKMQSEIISPNLGQILLTHAQIEWTNAVQQALDTLSTGSSQQVHPLKKVRNTYKKKTEMLVDCVDKQGISKLDRMKIVALIIMEEHNREVIEKIYANKSVTGSNSFEWLQQLRFIPKNEDEGNQLFIQILQLNASFPYGYEYQGNNGRLVVTPLTDRAYMTLTNALNLKRGGAPQGPAGTGKTETVKDLGKNLAFYVVIQNCSDQLDHLALGKIFAGLTQSGSWGCFDEFNRILLDVLSVIATQISAILECIKRGDKQQCVINELNVCVSEMTGLFITMNPGYAGRSELPDNLAALFRPVAMMAPNFQAIAKITLMSEGFKQNELLAKKVVTIYDLMKRQLSKPTHYDFNMRAIKSVLNAAGRIKREREELDETSVIIKAIRDMNLPKFLAEDVVLFDNLFIDLFPDLEEPELDMDDLQLAIEDSLIAKNMQLNENLVVKVMQLYECKRTRHGNMLLGATQSGKTKAWEILADALNLLHEQEAAKLSKKAQEDHEWHYMNVKYEVINPKSITLDELYGFQDDKQSPPQWQEGVLSSVLKNMCSVSQDKKDDVYKWMILDGPVDTLWIETMNSVLDDNKLLTLANSDRIALTPNVRLLFEVLNLDVASPATVSRAGIIFMDIEELGWRPIMDMWVKSKMPLGEDYVQTLEECVKKYLPKVLTVKKTQCKELVKTSESACIRHMCSLFDALITTKDIKQGEEEDRASFLYYIEKWFVFSLIWSIGATVDEKSRRDISDILRDIEPMFPHANTVFEYQISTEKKDFQAWDAKLNTTTLKFQGKEFHEIYVPTVDTLRNRFLTQTLLDYNSQILLVGLSGVGKTVLLEGILNTLDALTAHFTINFSAGTTAANTQEIIEAQYDRRAKNKFVPKNSKKKAVCFIDDLNMPRKEEYGAQPPLELLRQHIDYGFWYDRKKASVKNFIQDLQMISAMGEPGGGRAEISTRLLSQFHVINYIVPSRENMQKIFETIANFKFAQFYDEIKQQATPLAEATINLFHTLQEIFLPTPAKSHYVFNMRDISKVFQGLHMAERDSYESKEQIIKLWGHEIMRVFHDRLVDVNDQNKLKEILNEQLETYFQMNYKEHCMTNMESDAVFVDFLLETNTYEEVTDMNALKSHLQQQLSDYNSIPKQKKMDIVLFKDALIHVSKIYRVLNLKRGNVLLVGVGGSGRHSLTRLSGYIAEMNAEQLEIRRDFDLKAFRKRVMEMYEKVVFGKNAKRKSVFLFSDNDVVHESFLEDIQNMLNSGMVPNLYSQDELARVREDMRKEYKRAGQTNESAEAMNEFFFTRVKDNMHLSICMSPVGETFRNYCRMYPALINNTTIDWFMAWPEEALIEVADKFLGQEIYESFSKQILDGLAQFSAYTHTTTQDSATAMKNELKRIFYVTPTNFIELLKGYEKILTVKKQGVEAQIKKLTNGLGKLEEARADVEVMTEESGIKRAEVSKKTQECEALQLEMSRQKKEADEKQKIIEVETEKIEKETLVTQRLAQEAEAELQKAMPSLLAAQDAVNSLDKKHISEIKAYSQPPEIVLLVMSAVMICLQKEPTWHSAKVALADPKFVDKILQYNKENIPSHVMKRIEKFTQKPEFQPTTVTRKSHAAGALCMWVRSIEDYAKALKIVNPKKEKKAAAEAELAKMKDHLAKLQSDYQELEQQLKALDLEYTRNNDEMMRYKAELEQLQNKIERGEQLISGLGDEEERWKVSLTNLHIEHTNLTGDCILSAAFMSYCGPFPSDYRQQLATSWLKKITKEGVPHTSDFEFSEFLAGKNQARQWQIQGLPTDDFSTENGVFVTKGLRWALNIDPQTQANKWIKKMCQDHLVIADAKDKNFIKKIETAVVRGHTILLQDVEEEIDPTLDNILNKAWVPIRQGSSKFTVKLGDREIEYNKKFQLYITTRMSNPHYTPEISTKVAVVNFTVKESGLEEQCLGIVVESEQPNLENSKNEMVARIAESKAKIIKLEDEILKRLNEDDVNLLEDISLIEKLNTSKITSDNVKQTLDQSEVTMKRIDDTRETFRACGRKAATLFFVLNDLNKINPMYQFSLDWYKDLFRQSIRESKETVSPDRMKAIITTHTLNVYNASCRSLFERHKLLLSLQMCIKLQIAEGQVDKDEYAFFLRGGTVLDRANQPPKPPFDWITQQAWDHITELEKALPDTFANLSGAIALSPKEWHHWFSSDKPEPENAQLPGEWETKCEDRLKKMIILRCFRPDRVNFAIRQYVFHNMKNQEFITSRPPSLAEIFEKSQPDQPIIFVLSPGVDPTEQLSRFADELNMDVSTISLGKGQSEKAIRILTEGAEKGNWCFLSNCHLSVGLLPELENKLDELFTRKINKSFRLFLSAAPHEKFPISLLQRSLKITSEPPRGIKANVLRLYRNMSKTFTPCENDQGFRKSVYGLCWFHTILIERKKFKTLGWNVSYAFNDSDYQVCEDTLANYMGVQKDGVTAEHYDKTKEVNWTAIQYLIAMANYGGRVTDDRDRILIKVYAQEIFGPDLIAVEKWRPVGTDELNYQYPLDEANFKGPDPQSLLTPDYFQQLIADTMENNDLPQAYGQHTNAEITSQIMDSMELLDAILSLQPAQTSSTGQKVEDKILNMIAELKENVPVSIDVQQLKFKFRNDDNPLNVVLMQEIQRYNILLDIMRKSLHQLEQGIQGFQVISPDLEQMMENLDSNKVPISWGQAYFSLKPLANWIEDLRNRYAFFNEWVTKGMPFVFHISYFTYPTGFTTSLLQRQSRKAGAQAIDRLEFDFITVSRPKNDILEHAKEGAYICGLFLEGAKWNLEKQYLCEPEVMELHVPMPVIHFKPITKRAKALHNVYQCPTYYYPKREGVIARDSFMFYIDLKSGEYPPEFWVKRGTAILMSLAN